MTMCQAGLGSGPAESKSGEQMKQEIVGNIAELFDGFCTAEASHSSEKVFSDQ